MGLAIQAESVPDRRSLESDQAGQAALVVLNPIAALLGRSQHEHARSEKCLMAQAGRANPAGRAHTFGRSLAPWEESVQRLRLESRHFPEIRRLPVH